MRHAALAAVRADAVRPNNALSLFSAPAPAPPAPEEVTEVGESRAELNARRLTSCLWLFWGMTMVLVLLVEVVALLVMLVQRDLLVEVDDAQTSPKQTIMANLCWIPIWSKVARAFIFNLEPVGLLKDSLLRFRCLRRRCGIGIGMALTWSA